MCKKLPIGIVRKKVTVETTTNIDAVPTPNKSGQEPVKNVTSESNLYIMGMTSTTKMHVPNQFQKNVGIPADAKK